VGKLGKKFGADSKNEHYFVVGLLHDIGKIVFDLFFSELFQQALEKAHSKDNEGLYVAERSIIGFDHGEVGGILLTRWKFPDVITAPIAVHHQLEFPEAPVAGDVAMLRIADVLPQELGLGAGGNPFPPEINEADLVTLKMSEKELEDTRASLDSAGDGIYELFSAMI
jgi:HD-like signal output (HDOD) protein